MDNWDKFLRDWLENSQREFTVFWQQLNQDWQKSRVQLEESLGNFAVEIEEVLTEELSEFINEVDTLMDDFVSIIINHDLIDETNHNSSNSDYIIWLEEEKVKPSSQHHPACVGCQHFHGQIYGENLLVCAMHPYGWSDDNCPDWEGDNSDN
jgi:hypothetical protein